MRRVVVVGMGFGGIRAARALSGAGMEVILVDRQNYHLFQPLLYQVATAALEQESIAYPVRAMARRWKGVSFLLSEVCGVDMEGKRVLLPDRSLEFDYLILAPGSVTNFFGMTNVARHAYDLKRLDHAVDLRNQILGSFEQAVREQDAARRQALLTFVIVGGGPTGVEFAGALAELVHFVLTKDYPELHVSDTRIILLEAVGTILAAFPEKLQLYAINRLEKMGVEIMLDTRVVDATPERVIFHDGTAIGAHTLFWSAGVAAAPLAGAIDVRKGPAGRILVENDLSLPGNNDIYVIGDAALLEQDGAPLPMIAPVAMQQGEYAARSILAREHGRHLPPFRYRDKGSMATIGRSAAVARTMGMAFSGYPAWVVWLGLHLFYLIGFRNRLLVMLNWAYYYLFHERQVRLITRDSDSGTC